MRIMKKIVTLLIVLMALLVNSCDKINPPTIYEIKNENYGGPPPNNIFESIIFGEYEWIVLTKRDGRLLVISKNILFEGAYHHTFTEITWANSSLRHYLNNEFYNSFSSADRGRILVVTNLNDGGNPTQDKIFLLSYNEVLLSFGFERLEYDKLNTEDHNSNRVATYAGDPHRWWQRTPGPGLRAPVVSSNGSINGGSYNVDDPNGGVRPAMWLKL